MTQLMWNAVGERTFEAGVDRGVLYLRGVPGVPWNGLISVSETPTGSEVEPLYIDGIKYLNHLSREEFEATIEAYTYPEEFEKCDGTRSVNNGLSLSQQPREIFSLSYRTMVGNDVSSIDHGYKIHLVYGATATPTERPNNTIEDEIEPFDFSWEIVTKPPIFTGYAPTSHFVIDSRRTPIDLLSEIEDILYGSSESTPRLPSVSELLFLFEQYQPSIFDAGFLTEEYFNEFDAGIIPEPQTSTIDGGGP